VHKEPADAKVLVDLAKSTDPLFSAMWPHWEKILKLLGSEHPERFHFLWRFAMSDMVFMAAYKHWLETQKLLGRDEAAAMILGRGAGGKKAGGDKMDVKSGPAPAAAAGGAGAAPRYQIEIDLEDYLIGLANLPKELSRLCVNCVRCANYSTPQAISKFVLDLYSGFRLLNLRNDVLRRKFDGIKYDVTRLEEVMYDLSVRKLGTQAGGPAGIEGAQAAAAAAGGSDAAAAGGAGAAGGSSSSRATMDDDPRLPSKTGR